MANRRRSNLQSAGWQAAKFTYRTADKAAGGLLRWATTDHLGVSQRLANMPSMGFLGTIRFILGQLLFGIAGAVLTGVWVFVLIAYGIPFLITGHF